MATYPGCETCIPDYTSTTGDFQREKAQASYLAQYTRAAHLLADIANGIVQLHHVLGIIYADDLMDDSGLQTYPNPPDYFIADTYTRFDIDSGLSFTNRVSDAVQRRAAVQSIAATAAAIEGSMMMQLADVVDTSSTATRFEWANAPPCPDGTGNVTTCEDPASAGGPAGQPRKFFAFAPSTAVPSARVLWEKQTTPPPSGSTEDGNPQYYGVTFQQLLVGDIGSYTSAGFQVTAPQESFLGPGQRGGYVKQETTGEHPVYGANFTKQRGGTLIATKYDSNYNPTDIAHDVVGLISGSPAGGSATPLPAKGGGGGAQPNGNATYNPNDAADVLKSKFVDRSNLFGVDLKTGTMSETSPGMIETGSGDFPYSLSASLDWKAGPPPSDPADGPIPLGQPGSGWNLNWLSNLATSGSGMEAMGFSDIRDAAATASAFIAEQDIYISTDPLISVPGTNKPYAQRDTAVALTQAWLVHQIDCNVATVSIGKSARQFVHLPDDTWIEPGAGHASMTLTGNRVLSQLECPGPQAGQAHYALSRGWNYNGVTYFVANQHGDVEKFIFWVSHYPNPIGAPICARQSGFRLDSWSFPYGITVTPTYAATTDFDSHMINAPSGPFPSANVPTGVMNNVGRSLAFTQDTFGDIIGVKDGTRTLTISLFQSPSDFTADPGGSVTTYAYLAPQPTNNNPATTLTRPVPYEQLTQVFTADNPAHANIQYDYDTLGQVQAVHDAYAVLHPTNRGPYNFYIGDSTRGERDDPMGGPYSVTFDIYGHAARYQDELNRLTQVSIDSRGRPAQYIYPEGDQEVFGYDVDNNMTSYEKIGTSASCTPTCPTLTATAVYDLTWNKPLTITNFRSKTTTLTYFPLSSTGASLIASATRPLDSHMVAPVYSFDYDAKGKPLHIKIPFTSGEDITTSETYDPVTEDLKTSTLDPGTGHVAAVTSYDYDSYGNVTSITDSRGNATVLQYDLNRKNTFDYHHMGNATAPLDLVSQTKYDAIERDVEEDIAKCFDNATTCPQTGSSVVTWVAKKKITYTPTSKVASITDADGAIVTNFYDNDDRLGRTVDPVGRQKRYVYDAAGQKLREIRAWNSGTGCTVTGTLQECYAIWTYGGDGERLTEMDANGAIASPHYFTSYAYDGFLRLATTTFPDGSSEKVKLYDENGNIVQHVNRAGQEEDFTYDNLDRALSKLMPAVTGVNPAITTSYDYYLNAAPYTENDTLGNGLTYGYDTAGRQTSIATAIPGLLSGAAQTTSYVLDANGNRTALIWPDNYCAAYAFDARDMMTTVTEGSASGGSCTPSGAVLATYTNDAMSRRTSLAYPHANMAYTYSDGDDLLTLNHTIAGTGAVPSYTLTYTGAHQLLTEASSNSTFVWQPAAAHTDTYSAANTLNQYTTINGAAAGGHDCQGNAQQYSYDCNGNLTGDGTWTYSYDPENRLITAAKTAGGVVSATYAYDTKGRRTHKSGAGVSEAYFLTDGSDPIADYNGAGAENFRYVPGATLNEPAAAITVSTGARRYYLLDYHGSTVAAVNNAGTQIEGPYTYDSWGNCFSGSSPCASNTAPFKYVGMRFDAETGLYYDRARMYSPALGRFIQVDPVSDTADLNLYLYVGNDPGNRADLTGTLDPGEIPITRNNTKGSPPSPFNDEDPYTNEAESKSWSSWWARRLNGVMSGTYIISGLLHSVLDKNAKETMHLWRLYGGTADQWSKDDATTGTYFMAINPLTVGNADEIRQTWALAKNWGNDLSKFLEVEVDVKDITSSAITAPQKGDDGTIYKGGGVEVVVTNAKVKAHVVSKGPSGLGNTLKSPDEGTCMRLGISCQQQP
ncbi:MAG TPA: RHS repeat-associated core domain-containing protein [Rhizomicrobium sp.]